MLDRVKITASGKQQLITLKRRTGIEHYNVIGRHALCVSLANSSKAPFETLQFSNGLEIDWGVFAGEASQTYLNLLIERSIQDEGRSDASTVRHTLTAHLHRGLSYLTSRPDLFWLE